MGLERRASETESVGWCRVHSQMFSIMSSIRFIRLFNYGSFRGMAWPWEARVKVQVKVILMYNDKKTNVARFVREITDEKSRCPASEPW